MVSNRQPDEPQTAGAVILYFKVKTAQEVFEILKGFKPLDDETVSINDVLGRTLIRDIISLEDVPGFARSSMDGYAVIAKDTFGASESLPALLKIKGDVLIGKPPALGVEQGQTVRISTGGMLPEGADGVVMLEYCHSLDENTIEVSRVVSPFENVIKPDDDFQKNAVILRKGHVLRPQDLGVLAGLGIRQVSVSRRPKIAIISTGDEIIPIEDRPEPGQVRDINTYTLSAFCRQTGADPIVLGLCGDSFSDLKEQVEKGLKEADSVWISGGSSVGTRDFTLKVFESFEDMELLVHCISISPGKPTIIARVGPKALFGLPGHTTSALVVAEVFLSEFLSGLSGAERSPEEDKLFVSAELSRNVESVSGRDDYIRVRLEKKGDNLVAEPVFGKSGLISTLVKAQGLVCIDRNTEGLYRGQKVKVLVFSRY